ncbi:MAG: TonB-dependent receptor [Acidobacteriota bacterium]
MTRPLAILFVAAALARGQTTSTTGTIRGVVVDSSGASVPGALVTAVNQQTRTRREAHADTGGQFYLGTLAAGTYTVRAEATGFAPAEVGPFPLSVGQLIQQKLGLQPAGVVETLEVTEQPEAVDVTAATASVALGGDRIEEAPARSRSYLNFVLAAPGVAPSAGASSQRSMTGVRAPLADSGFTFNGMRPRNNAILIDGVDNRDETTGGNRVAIGLEMVQEFRVAGAAVGAELGGAAGGLLNMVTRSGVNVWHGDATFFAQNEFANARKPEVAIAGTPRFRRYQPGTSLMGPLRKDRTFFAAAVEHERESAQEWSDVPEAVVAPVNRALATAAYAGTGVRSVLRGLYGTQMRGTEFSAKFNHQASAKDTLSARYAYSRGSVRGEVQGPDNFADRSAQGSSLTIDHSLVGNWLRIVSPATVNEFRAQIAERTMGLEPNGAGPMLEIPGVVTLGAFARMDAGRKERHYQVVENLNTALGGHRLSVGADAHLVRFDGSLRDRFAGVFLFPTLSDFVGARPDVFVQAFGTAHTRMDTLPVGLWAQDRWEARPGLHLELGARFDRQRMPTGLPASSNNVAPRVGLSWRPVPKRPLVLRAGLGLFYDRYPLAYLNPAVQKDGNRGFEQYLTGTEAAAAFRLNRGGALAQPLPFGGQATYTASQRFPSTYGRKFSVGMEQGFGSDTSLAVEFNQISGFHLPRIRNVAGQLPPTYELNQTAMSEYTGASISLNRHFNHELAYLVTYTVGRTRDDASDFDEQPQDPRNTRADWALSRQHQLHRLAASAVFDLPVEAWDILPEWAQKAFEEISLAPIFTIGSGRPINALFTTDLFRTGAYPISARAFGLARNPFRSPRTTSLDLRVMKTFHVIHGRALLQFAAESFNLTNHANTERVSQYFASPEGKLDSYGTPLESLPARQIQFLVQLEF